MKFAEDYTDIVEALGILSDQPTHKEVLVAIKSQAVEIKELKAEVETVNNVNGRMCSQICDLEDEVEEINKSPWVSVDDPPKTNRPVFVKWFHETSMDVFFDVDTYYYGEWQSARCDFYIGWMPIPDSKEESVQ